MQRTLRGMLYRPFHLLSHSGDAAGKPGGVPCIHLSEDYSCKIYGQPDRPRVCDDFKADPEICGTSREEALILLGKLEQGLP